ncbi:dimethylsulfonioproprionate lyase family protein [Pontivivens insulae]|uniref:Dimethlysulfonioproprionate lyase DddL n=1 Tax=Pontivivens insulae TaxID=1639689 RepID=A0A2R8ADC3_9RHOB|nr:dimethylsulfonioproprionate lyase family protein [Pontivivens insulae]RED13996.1 dimethylsulfoniopropionate lyase DddL [Pontivivens insulae]SPF30070.1 Putative dimethlysulfonioproprionate lyase DddL [Pontivivens insulae]
MDAATRTLSDCPDWRYLLREFYEMYRTGPAGGSKVIAGHQRRVRERIGKVITENPAVIAREAEDKPVTAHLRRALDQGRRERTESMIRAIEAISPELSWLYGYEKVPRGLAKKYAFAEFAGPHGPIQTQQLILGIVLFAPQTTYPAHAHDGLTESYLTLSGAVSENDEGVFAPGSMIFNPPGRKHRLTTSSNEPTLLAYAWEGPAGKLSDQKMAFTKQRRSST